MPDGKEVFLGSELITAPEIMFGLRRADRDENWCSRWPTLLPHCVAGSIFDDCDIDIRRDLVSNVVMAGGNTLIPGMPERLQKELEVLTEQKTRPWTEQCGSEPWVTKVIAPPERGISGWIGGSILAELSTFEGMWIQRRSNPDATPPVVGYDEIGARIVHQHCNT